MSQHAFLYVDDDTLSREVVSILLTKVMGFSQVAVFEDSANFPDRLRALPCVPDIIFLDIQMEPYDGYQVLQMLRGMEEYRHTCIVALTANVMATDMEHLRAVGFNGLIGKPIKQQLFTQNLKKLLAGEEIWVV